MNQFQGSFVIPRGRGCRWTSGALCIRHTRAAIFEHFNPLTDNSTRQNFIPTLSTHAETNLCSRHIFCPQKPYDETLFLFGAIYKFRSHLHHSVTTVILNCKVSRLARMTSHMTLSDTTNYYSSHPHHFPRKYKSAENFWRFFICFKQQDNQVSHDWWKVDNSMFYLWMWSVAHTILHQMTVRLANNELQKMRQQSWPNLRNYSNHFSGGK